MDMHKIASKEKYRFTTTRGTVLTTEDLWDIRIGMESEKIPAEHQHKTLNEVAKKLHREILATTEEENFVGNTKAADPTLTIKLAIVKDVIKTRIDELEKERKKQELRAKSQQLMALISQNENKELEQTPTADLRKQLEEIQKSFSELND